MFPVRVAQASACAPLPCVLWSAAARRRFRFSAFDFAGAPSRAPVNLGREGWVFRFSFSVSLSPACPACTDAGRVPRFFVGAGLAPPARRPRRGHPCLPLARRGGQAGLCLRFRLRSTWHRLQPVCLCLVFCGVRRLDAALPSSFASCFRLFRCHPEPGRRLLAIGGEGSAFVFNSPLTARAPRFEARCDPRSPQEAPRRSCSRRDGGPWAQFPPAALKQISDQPCADEEFRDPACG